MSRLFTKNQYLQRDTAILTSYPYTVSCWVNDAGTETTFPFLLALFTNGTNAPGTYAPPLYLDNTGKLAGYGVVCTATRPINTWFHACTVQTSATSHAIFQDGGNKTTSTTSAPWTAGMNRTSINAWNGGVNVGIDGLIAQVGIWNAALTDEEVASLANGLPPIKIRASSLISYYPMNRSSLTTEIDIISSYDMTNFGSTAGSTDPRIFLPYMQSAPRIFPSLGADPLPPTVSSAATGITSILVSASGTPTPGNTITNFIVQRSLDQVSWTPEVTFASTYEYTGLLANTTYYFRVKFQQSNGQFSSLAYTNATTDNDAVAPNAPTITAVANIANAVDITVTGTPTTGMTIGANSYDIQRLNNQLITTGLAFAYDPAASSSYPGSGTTLNDLTINNNTATLNGGITYDSVNKVFNLNGVNGYISTSKQYTNPQLFSMGVWFNTTATAGKKIMGFTGLQLGQETGNYDRQLYIGTDNKLYFGIYNPTETQVTVSTSSTVNDGAWHYAVGTLNSSGVMKLYLDGVFIAQRSTLGAENYSGYWKIGSYQYGGWPNTSSTSYPYPSGGYIGGSIGAVQVYDVELTPSEIVQNYNAYVQGKITNGTITTGPWTSIANTATFQDINLPSPATYYYRARFTQSNNQTSPYSTVANATTFAGAPIPQELTDVELMNLGYAVVTQDYPMPGTYAVSGTNVTATGLVAYNKLNAWNIKTGLTRIKIDGEIRTVSSISTDSLTVSSAFTTSGSGKTMYLVAADKTGVEDSLAVIQAWIKQSSIGEFTNPTLAGSINTPTGSANSKRAPVWFPSGTYSVSDSIRIFSFERPNTSTDPNQRYGGTYYGDWCQLYGSAAGVSRPKIKLRASATGFQDPNNPKPVVVFMHFGCSGTTAAEFSLAWPYRNYYNFPVGTNPPGGSPQWYTSGIGGQFYTVWCGIDIDTGLNPGAFGLMHNGCQYSALVNCKVTATSSYGGFRGLPAAGSPTVNIEVEGGQYGLRLDPYLSYSTGSGSVASNLKMTNITVQGIVLSDYCPFTVAGFEITMTSGKFVGSTDNSSVYQNASFIDGYVTQPSNLVFDMTSGSKSFYIKNVYTKGTTQLIKYKTNATIVGPSSTDWNLISEYASSNDQIGTGSVKYVAARSGAITQPVPYARHWNIINGSMAVGALNNQPIIPTVTSTATPPADLRTRYSISIPLVDSGPVVYATDYMPAATGTITVQSNKTTIIGTGTNFLTELKIGDAVVINRCTRRVRSITSNQNLEVYPPLNEVVTNVTMRVGSYMWNSTDSLQLSGTFSYTTGSTTVTCSTGHNVQVGMWIVLAGTRRVTSIISSTQFTVDSALASTGASSSVVWYLSGPLNTESAKPRAIEEALSYISGYKSSGDTGKDSLGPLQAAVDAAQAASHGRVVLPMGGFMNSGTLSLKSKTVLFGLGTRHSALSATATWIPTTDVVLLSTINDVNATTTLCNFQIYIPRTVGSASLQSITGQITYSPTTTITKTYTQYSGDRFSCIDWKAGKGLVIMYTSNSEYVEQTDTLFSGAYLKISGSGGGRFYGLALTSGWGMGNQQFYEVLIDGTTQPVHIFAHNPEHKQTYPPIIQLEPPAGAVIRNASNVRMYNSKREGDTSTVLIENSNNVAYYDAGGALGNYNATVRGNSNNILITNIVPQDSSYVSTDNDNNLDGYVFMDETLPAVSGTVTVSGSVITGTGLLAKLPPSTPPAGYASVVAVPAYYNSSGVLVPEATNPKNFGSLLLKINSEVREVATATDTQITVRGTYSASGLVTMFPILGVKVTEILSIYKKGTLNDSAMFTPGPLPPPAVLPISSPTVALTVMSQISIDVNVTAQATSGSTVTSYTIERSLDGVAWSQIYTGASNIYVDNTLTASTTYYYRAKFSQSDGRSSSYSSTVNATTNANVAPGIAQSGLLFNLDVGDQTSYGGTGTDVIDIS